MGTGDNLREARNRRLLKQAEGLRERIGEAVLTIEDFVNDPRDANMHITEVRLTVRYGEVGDILVVVKRTDGDKKEIAFHSADTVSEAVSGLASRLRNGSLSWREDTPYDNGSGR